MKHLRKYNESLSSTNDFDVDFIKDCFIDFIDKECTYEIHESAYMIKNERGEYNKAHTGDVPQFTTGWRGEYPEKYLGHKLFEINIELMMLPEVKGDRSQKRETTLDYDFNSTKEDANNMISRLEEVETSINRIKSEYPDYYILVSDCLGYTKEASGGKSRHLQIFVQMINPEE